MRTRGGIVRLGGLLGASLLLLAISGTAASADTSKVPEPTQASLTQVFSDLGVNNVSADYVVLIDTSGSMQSSGRYAMVQSALSPFFQAMSPSDHLSLITFDTTPALRFSGPVGTSGGSQALAQLPSQALGQHTDIGAALSAGLSELERPGANSIGTLVIATDGLQDAPPGSLYPTTTGPSWQALGVRGKALEATHDISAFAVALTADTDASTLTEVLPNALVEDLPANQLPSFLDRVKQETSIAKGRQILASDAGKGVVASWSTPTYTFDQSRQETLKETLTLHSTLVHEPVVVSGLNVTAKDVPLTATNLPSSISLAPGQTVSYPVTITHPAGGFSFGLQHHLQRGNIGLSAAITSPWDSVLKSDFQMSQHPTLQAQTFAVATSGTVAWNLFTVVLVVVAVGLFIAAMVRKKRSTPEEQQPEPSPNQMIVISHSELLQRPSLTALPRGEDDAIHQRHIGRGS